ncbi:hypothetical protein M0804_003776 [Polistes exclamans]|nr:hypothetical protein M0804_003776 [Polistes exclamans]
MVLPGACRTALADRNSVPDVLPAPKRIPIRRNTSRVGDGDGDGGGGGGGGSGAASNRVPRRDRALVHSF